jgi:hypothetical protein
MHFAAQMVTMPHPHTAWIVCRKAPLAGLGVRWYGYCAPLNGASLAASVDLGAFLAWHYPRHTVSSWEDPTQPCRHVSTDIGAWVYHAVEEAGLKFGLLPEDTIDHFFGMSWLGDPARVDPHLARYAEPIGRLERELDADPFYGPLYREFVPPG